MATLDPIILQQLLSMRVPEAARTTTQTVQDSSKENVATRNMTSEALAALDAYIMQLVSGGTPEMQAQQAARTQEINTQRTNQAGYSKAAAFNDASGAMNQYVRQLMEKNMPTLVRSAEGAGTSQNSLRALMTQQLMTQAAEGAAAVGLDAASKYGNVSAGFGSILERLTQADNTLPQALAAAFQAAKGAVQNTTTTREGTKTATTVGSQIDALNALSGMQRRGPTSISAGSDSPSFGPGPGHSFPQMAGMAPPASVGGGAAGYSNIFSQQKPGQDALPDQFTQSSMGRTNNYGLDPAAEATMWSNRSTERAIAEMLGGSPSWSGYGQV